MLTHPGAPRFPFDPGKWFLKPNLDTDLPETGTARAPAKGKIPPELLLQRTWNAWEAKNNRGTSVPARLDDFTMSCGLFGRFFLYFRVGMLIWHYHIHQGGF